MVDHSVSATVGCILGIVFTVIMMTRSFEEDISSKSKFLIQDNVYRCKKLEVSE